MIHPAIGRAILLALAATATLAASGEDFPTPPDTERAASGPLAPAAAAAGFRAPGGYLRSLEESLIKQALPP